MNRPTGRKIFKPGILVLIFVATLPLANPWVRGDGVGYYAYIRSLMVEHRIDFAPDWRAANESFVMGRLDGNGNILPTEYTKTGQLNNHWSVGASLLWAPFLIPVHGVMLALHHFGLPVKPDGYSRSYIVAMALATAFYGFIGLLLSFRLACRYTQECWAWLATLGIWFATSLPVYMYFNPSWSHAHSVFAVALFLAYWQRTREARTASQWIVLGLLSGLMLDVYYLNVALLAIPLLESLGQYSRSWQSSGRDWGAIRKLLRGNVAYLLALIIAIQPTLICRRIITGNPFDLGYASEWRWKPALIQVLVSSDHGLLTWTPILILAIVGWVLLRKQDKQLANYVSVSAAIFYLMVCFHTNWDGLSSFGNRFFISLTPFFIIGLAAIFQAFAERMRNARSALAGASSLTALLILWNLAFIFQWGTHMVPARGPISWKQMARNQFLTVPRQAMVDLRAYATNRRGLMRQIEQEDVRQLKVQESGARSQ